MRAVRARRVVLSGNVAASVLQLGTLLRCKPRPHKVRLLVDLEHLDADRFFLCLLSAAGDGLAVFELILQMKRADLLIRRQCIDERSMAALGIFALNVRVKSFSLIDHDFVCGSFPESLHALLRFLFGFIVDSLQERAHLVDSLAAFICWSRLTQ